MPPEANSADEELTEHYCYILITSCRGHYTGTLVQIAELRKCRVPYGTLSYYDVQHEICGEIAVIDRLPDLNQP